MKKTAHIRKQPASIKLQAKTTEAPILALEITDLIGKVKVLLQGQQAEKALETISQSKLKSPWVNNATGVCLLRLGETKQASRVFHDLAANSGVMLKQDAPLVFKTNYAAALLACDNMAGCLSVLHEISDEENPVVKQLRDAIGRWKRSLTLWQRLGWLVGNYPQRQTAWDGPHGELE